MINFHQTAFSSESEQTVHPVGNGTAMHEGLGNMVAHEWRCGNQIIAMRPTTTICKVRGWLVDGNPGGG